MSDDPYLQPYDDLDQSNHNNGYMTPQSSVRGRNGPDYTWNDYCLCIFDPCRDYARLLPQQLQDNLEGGYPDPGAIYCIYALN
jgi:hypothetical protein